VDDFGTVEDSNLRRLVIHATDRIGMLTGPVGPIQDTAVAKLILSVGEPLVDRPLTCDALPTTVRDPEF
jgi:molybdopterin/thiamine biosynthesis adenylyltransferase